jgi:hypothetical protein
MEDTATPPFPAGLAELFADDSGRRRTLPIALPPGSLVRPDPSWIDRSRAPAARPAYWLSDAQPPAGLWSRLRAAHHQSGLWPLLFQSQDDDPAVPWAAGQVDPQHVSEIDLHDGAAFLARTWADWAEVQEGEEDIGYDLEDLAPFGRDWPGLAPPGEPMEDPDVVADWYAGLVEHGSTHLGLVAAERSADTLAVIGWMGPANHAPTVALAAVVRNREDRFGVRVVRVGSDTLELSVAAPPQTTEHALHVAAEHSAFCPDNVGQRSRDVSQDTLVAYADEIRGKNSWGFWWD